MPGCKDAWQSIHVWVSSLIWELAPIATGAERNTTSRAYMANFFIGISPYSSSRFLPPSFPSDPLFLRKILLFKSHGTVFIQYFCFEHDSLQIRAANFPVQFS
jgi:hypothetical protein